MASFEPPPPDYSHYEKLLKIGQPLELVKQRVAQAGLDPVAFTTRLATKMAAATKASAARERDCAVPSTPPRPRPVIDLSGLAGLSLKPTTTVVRPHPCVGATEEFGARMLNDGGAGDDAAVDEDAATTRRCAAEIAALLKRAKHVVVFTGAGISTASGISDFRGAGGVWQSLARGVIPDDSGDLTAAAPTYAHMALAALVARGYVASVVSTNHDGLHMKSGLTPLADLAELHGNTYVERCPRCAREYRRAFPVLRTSDRYTGRNCECGGGLIDSGIDFGQTLPLAHLALAERAAARADVALVLGTSMRVAPACDLPTTNPACALALCNAMPTAFDGAAAVRSFGAIDELMRGVIDALGDVAVAAPPSATDLGLATVSDMVRRKFVLRTARVADREARGEPTADRNLPPGWSRWEDAETCGATYFFHSPTNRISWGRPTLSDDAADDDDDAGTG